MRPLIAIAAAVSAVTIAGAAAGCTSSQGRDHPSTSPPPATSSGTSTPPVTTETATAGSAALVAQWYEGVSAHFATIQTDTEAIKNAAQSQKVSDLPNLCGALQVHVATSLSDPAAPDKALAAAVSSALTAYGGAATSCLAGDYNGAAAGINKGAAYLTQANNIMANLS
jgi:hypothetical protein